MDPFLPGEIPVMVLRYLAANKCEKSALSLIEELPLLKSYVQPKPPKLSNTDYLKHLARSSVNPGLKEILTDYGNSKLLAEEILEENESSDFQLDSLLSKLKTLHELLKNTSTSGLHAPANNDLAEPNCSSAVLKVERSMNTDENYQCLECLSNRVKKKTVVESSCQTEEYTAVQFGLQDEIPLIFCKTLLGDDNLQHKIAHTINEHLQDSQDDKNEAVQKISSKAETEIDKFLVELLQGIPEDSNSALSENSLQNAGNSFGATSLPEIDSNLSSMFRDADILFENTNTNVSTCQTEMEPKKLPNFNTDTKETCEESPPSTSVRNSIQASSNSKEGNADDSLARTTPKQKQRASSIKRITPTPLANANVNPIFNTSVVVEKQICNANQPKVSVVTVNCEPPAWQKLHRKSITPKIPGSEMHKVIPKVTVVNKRNDNILKFAPPKNQPSTAGQARSNQSEQNIVDQSNPPSSHKRKKGTPVKLTPEKANNMEYNFMHVYHEPNKSSASKCNSEISISANDAANIKQTPNPSNSALKSSIKFQNVLLENENSLADVTPIQVPIIHQMSESEFKTISPNALKRLIASASRAGTVPSMIVNKKKSFSTPRKRKHVRSLTFATPPALKYTTTGSESDLSHKRKATEDLVSTDLKSKKRLSWNENDRRKQDTNLKVITTNTDVPVKLQATEIAATQELSTVNSINMTVADVPIPSMPTILEESLNGSQSLVTYPSTSISMVGNTTENQVWSPSSFQKLTLVTVPNNGNMQYQYLHVGEDLQTFYPVHFVTAETSDSITMVQQSDSTVHNANSPSHNVQPQQPPLSSYPNDIQQSQIQSSSFSLASSQPPTTSQFATTLPPILATHASAISTSTISAPSPSKSPNPKSLVAVIPLKTTHGLKVHESLKTSSDIINTMKPPEEKILGPSSQAIHSQSKQRKPKKRESKQQSSPPTNEEQTKKERKSSRVSVGQKPLEVEIISKEHERSSTELKTPPSDNVKSHSSAEQDCSKNRNSSQKTGRGRQQTAPKKPKVTLNVKDLFGESPSKKRNLRSSNRDSKRLAEVAAAQAVAAEAIPLGGTPPPRRSPRKHVLKTPQSEKGQMQAVATCQEANKISTKLNLGISSHPPPQQLEDHAIFNIVPAPLGFPEPTPIKNFRETGFLNITSEIGGSRSPLITPLKSVPPSALNETPFTLPPTPRVIDDMDSNSNSTHSLKLFYDGGMYPVNLLTSTPLKAGPPRTPGKPHSSNSHSPISAEQIGTDEVPNEKPKPFVCNSSTPMNLSSRDEEKSDGEISSSNDSFEGESGNVKSHKPTDKPKPTSESIRHKPNPGNAQFQLGNQFQSQKQERNQPYMHEQLRSHHNPQGQYPNQRMDQKPFYNQPNSQNPLNIPDARNNPGNDRLHQPASNSNQASKLNKNQSKQTQLPLIESQCRPPSGPIQQPQPSISTAQELRSHISTSLNSNIKSTHSINFQVGGRTKELTMSEQETLFSLVQMHQSGMVTEQKNENYSPNFVNASDLQKPNTEPPTPHHLFRNKNLGDLINYIHRKNKHP